MKNTKLGVVGCGTIGAEIATAVSSEQIDGYILAGLCDIDVVKAQRLSVLLDQAVEILDLDELIAASEIIFEATNKAAMPTVARKALGAGKTVLVMSAGGLADDPSIVDLAEEKGGLLCCPSGAICGVDGILAAREAGLQRVRITSTKHPKSLRGAPFLVKHNVIVDGLSEPTTVFEGTAREAIEAFPANANVSITLSTAGLGIDRTEVRIVADPDCKRTKHEIVAEGDFGNIRTVTEGNVAPGNPRTGYLAILSAKAALRKVNSRFCAGT